MKRFHARGVAAVELRALFDRWGWIWVRGCAQAVLLSLAFGCSEDGSEAPCDRPVEPVTVVSFNLANQVGVDVEASIAALDRSSPDLAAVQECVDCDALAERLAAPMRVVDSDRAGVAILYDPRRWQAIERGEMVLGNNDDGWGERVARWARLVESSTGACAWLISTHFCVPIRSPDDGCDEPRQLEYVDAILSRIEDDMVPEDAVILGGDLNVFVDFENGRVIEALRQRGWIDAYRALVPDGDATTFAGNDWAPAGRLDYLFVRPPAEVLAARIGELTSAGSDHRLVEAVLSLRPDER